MFNFHPWTLLKHQTFSGSICALLSSVGSFYHFIQLALVHPKLSTVDANSNDSDDCQDDIS
jgi:hypothetical protein